MLAFVQRKIHFFIGSLPVRQEPVAERRRKYVDGLRFRVLSAGAFILLFAFLEVIPSFAFTGIFPSTAPILVVMVAANFVYWPLGRVSGFDLRLFYLHWFVDLLLISLSLHNLGGVDAPYAFFAYLTIVVTSATFISKAGSMIVATGAAIATLALVSLEHSALVTHNEIWNHHYGTQVQVVVVFVVSIFYFMFAYLAGTLADQLKDANSALDSARTAIEERNRTLETAVMARTEELQRRNAEIEEFVHIVTHDLKNLSVGAGETARKLLGLEGERLSERGQRYASYLLSDTRLVNEMLERLLGLFRAGQEIGQPVAVNPTKILQEICRAQRAVLEAKRVEVVLPELPILFVDERAIRHVLTNLFDNGVKYVGDKAPPRIEISGEIDGAMAVVRVSDNGIGIVEDQLPRIFDLYHRAPDQLVGGVPQKGSGVGLAICKRMVERWGGEMWVESQSGSGSTFSFTVPLPQSEEV